MELARVARRLAAVAGAMSLVCLSGWIASVPVLESIVPGLATMKFTTAIIVLLLALSWAGRRWTAALSASGAAALAAVQVLEYVAHLDLGIDQLVVTDHGHDAHPGRTSLAAAVCLLALALARLLTLTGRRRDAQVMAACVAAVGYVSALGYLYGVRSLYAIGPFSSISLPTVFAMTLLAAGSIVAVPGRRLAWAMHGADPGATLLRRLITFAALGLPLIGLLTRAVEGAGAAEGGSAIAFLVLVATVAVCGLSWVAARRVTRVDRRRTEALTELALLRDGLQREVDERVAQLQRRQGELVLIRERQRIAADLHDVVIQRLFAAGMLLDSVRPADPVAQRNTDAAVTTIDSVIADLRSSIFSLRTPPRATTLTDAVREICGESEVLLGFAPQVFLESVDAIPEGVRADLLAVLRESLANVAKHAAASEVRVTLRADDGMVVLSVVDDGIGVPETPSHSGTRNMSERASRHGGSCFWIAAVPSGTEVSWSVPRIARIDPMRTR